LVFQLRKKNVKQITGIAEEIENLVVAVEVNISVFIFFFKEVLI